MSNFRLSPAAGQDLENIHDFISTANPKAADTLVSSLIDKFVLLTTQPEMGRNRPELQTGIRCLPIKRYVIFYRLNNDIVEIVRVLNGYRDIDEIFQ